MHKVFLFFFLFFHHKLSNVLKNKAENCDRKINIGIILNILILRLKICMKIVTIGTYVKQKTHILIKILLYVIFAMVTKLSSVNKLFQSYLY